MWGFIDGTVHPICRLSHDQRIFYNGRKRTHALIFQAVTVPDGLITQLFGPVEGRRHDSGVLGESGLLPQLAAHMNGPNGIPYALYGDDAYPLSPYLQKAYQGAALTQAQQRFSTKMSKARVVVEWSFGDISSQWGYLAIKKQQKVAALLTNLQTSAYCSSWSALAASLPVDLALPPLCHYALGLFSLASQTLQPCSLLLFPSAMNQKKKKKNRRP